jgi:sec-independent protein translocase protein TatA
MPIGPWELLIILFVLILFFGAKKLPEMGRALGFGMREFKEGIAGDRSDELEERRVVTRVEPGDEEDSAAQRSRVRASQ